MIQQHYDFYQMDFKKLKKISYQHIQVLHRCRELVMHEILHIPKAGVDFIPTKE